MSEELNNLDAFKEAVGADEKVSSEAEVTTEEEHAEEVEEVEEVEAGEKSEETTEAPIERDKDLAGTLADLTHEDVTNSKAGKGLLGEIKQLREENRVLKAAKAAPAEADDDEDLADDAEELDDDADVFTRAQVKAIVAKELKAHLAKGTKATKPELTQSLQAGLDLLVKAQVDGEIPAALKTDDLVKTAIAELKKSNPALLRGLMAEPNPVLAIWDHSAKHVPAVRTAIAAAAKAQKGVVSERLAKGQSPGGDAPISVDKLVEVLNNRHKQKWE